MLVLVEPIDLELLPGARLKEAVQSYLNQAQVKLAVMAEALVLPVVLLSVKRLVCQVYLVCQARRWCME